MNVSLHACFNLRCLLRPPELPTYAIVPWCHSAIFCCHNIMNITRMHQRKWCTIDLPSSGWFFLVGNRRWCSRVHIHTFTHSHIHTFTHSHTLIHSKIIFVVVIVSHFLLTGIEPAYHIPCTPEEDAHQWYTKQCCFPLPLNQSFTFKSLQELHNKFPQSNAVCFCFKLFCLVGRNR
jgi:hypothetical protein